MVLVSYNLPLACPLKKIFTQGHDNPTTLPLYSSHVAPLSGYPRALDTAAMCVSRTCAVACALMLVGANAFVAGPTLLPRVKGGLSAATAGATRRPAGSLAMVRERGRQRGHVVVALPGGRRMYTESIKLSWFACAWCTPSLGVRLWSC